MTIKVAADAGIRKRSVHPPGRPGDFPKGKSGNPKGPKVVRNPVNLSALCRTYTEKAVRILGSIAEDPDAPPAARISAVKELLDRGYGRAPLNVQIEGDGAREAQIRQIFESAAQRMAEHFADSTQTVSSETICIPDQSAIVVEPEILPPEPTKKAPWDTTHGALAAGIALGMELAESERIPPEDDGC